MRYDDKYEKTEGRLTEVIDYIDELTQDRFIASLYVRQISPVDVQIRLAEVRRCLSTVNGESLRLSKLASTYNLDFAVADNQRFTTAERLFNRLRSSMSIIRRELRKSCPIVRRRPINPNIRPSVFERSVLTKGCCARDLFDITTFDDNVQTLYFEERALFANVILSLSICYRVIKEEREIKANPEQCVRRLDKQCERILAELEGVIGNMKEIPECEIQKQIDQMGKEAFAQKNFHGRPVADVWEYAIHHAQQLAKDSQLSMDLSMTFKSPERATDALIVIAHFDELRPSKRKMMEARKIRLFCNWCDGGTVDNPKRKYYETLMKYYHGKQKQFPQWHAITTCKGRCDMDEEQRKFNAEIDELLKKYKNGDEKKVS